MCKSTKDNIAASSRLYVNDHLMTCRNLFDILDDVNNQMIILYASYDKDIHFVYDFYWISILDQFHSWLIGHFPATAMHR